MTAPTPPKDRAVTVGGWIVLIVTALFGIRVIDAVSQLIFGG